MKTILLIAVASLSLGACSQEQYEKKVHPERVAEASNRPCQRTPEIGSSAGYDYKGKNTVEVGPFTYGAVQDLVKCHPALKPTIAKLLVDGKLTVAEYDQIVDARWKLYAQQQEREQRKAAQLLKVAVTAK